MSRLHAITDRSPRALIPARYYPLFLTILFLSALGVTYAALRPINEMDWIRTVQQVRNMWRGVTPFCQPYCVFTDFDPDLPVNADYTSTQAYSPWVMFFFAHLAYLSARGMIALTVAAWVMIVIDSGRPITLILTIHPTFLMLWAAANADFLIHGVGIWLIMRGVTGWRRGLVLAYMAIKPQVMPLLLVLEGLRMLWARDWHAVIVLIVIPVVAIALYPAWLLDTIPAYLDIAGGGEPAVDTGLTDYRFSVLGAWGAGAALAVTGAILVLMRHRLTEWRPLAIMLSLVWTPYVNPYSYALLLLLFRRVPPWRTVTYLAISLAVTPLLFTDFHGQERYGVLLFLLLAALLTTPDPAQREDAIANRHGMAPLPGVERMGRWQRRFVKRAGAFER